MKGRPFQGQILIFVCCLLGLWISPLHACATDTFHWNTNQSLVTADIKSSDLADLLQRIADATGWRVFVEPVTTRKVSAKFTELAPGEALRLLLGDVNFAVVPETNSSPRLFVFRTAQDKATQVVVPSKSKEGHAESKVIPNELIVRLK